MTRPHRLCYNTRMTALETVSSLFENRDGNDMPISTEILLSMLFSNLREQLTTNQRKQLTYRDERAIVQHQCQLMFSLSEEDAYALVNQYLGTPPLEK